MKDKYGLSDTTVVRNAVASSRTWMILINQKGLRSELGSSFSNGAKWTEGKQRKAKDLGRREFLRLADPACHE